MTFADGTQIQTGDKVFVDSFHHNGGCKIGTVKTISDEDELLIVEISGDLRVWYPQLVRPYHRHFKRGDLVRVVNPDINTHGLTGVVYSVQRERIAVDVDTPWAGGTTRRLYYNEKSLKKLVVHKPFKPSAAEPVVNTQLVGVFWGSKTPDFEDARIIWSGHGSTREDVITGLLASDTEFYPHLWAKFIGSGELEKLKYTIESA